MDVYGEDVTVDVPYPAGSASLTEQEIIDFATQWDPQPFHIDREYAAAGAFGGIIASGIHSFALFQRLGATHLYVDWHIIAGRAVRELTFPRPLRPDTTVHAQVTITRIDRRDDERSLLYKFGMLVDGSGDPVFTIRSEAYIRNRPR